MKRLTIIVCAAVLSLSAYAVDANSGKKFNCIKFGGYHPTNAKGQTLASAAPATDVSNIDDDQLPF